MNNGGLLLYIPSENQTVGTRVLEYLTGLLELTLQQREQRDLRVSKNDVLQRVRVLVEALFEHLELNIAN